MGFKSLIPDVGESGLGEHAVSFGPHRTFEAVSGEATPYSLLIMWDQRYGFDEYLSTPNMPSPFKL